jgi:hypothetical protein
LQHATSAASTPPLQHPLLLLLLIRGLHLQRLPKQQQMLVVVLLLLQLDRVLLLLLLLLLLLSLLLLQLLHVHGVKLVQVDGTSGRMGGWPTANHTPCCPHTAANQIPTNTHLWCASMHAPQNTLMQCTASSDDGIAISVCLSL